MKNPFIQLTIRGNAVGPLTLYISVEKIIAVTDYHKTGMNYECKIRVIDENSEFEVLDAFAYVQSLISAYYE